MSQCHWVTEYRKHEELSFSKSRGRPRKGKALPMSPKKTLFKRGKLRIFRTPTRKITFENRERVFKRAEEVTNGTTNERKVKLVLFLQQKYKFPLKEVLKITKLPKATYYYWKSRFGRTNKDEYIETQMLEIRAQHPNAGYRPMVELLKQRNIYANHKKVQRLMKNFSSNLLHIGANLVSITLIKDRLENSRKQTEKALHDTLTSSKNYDRYYGI